ncbi:hypothetical protein [Acinetobacter radioresistens]|uniref:hypothetical protein n=1 Tax=Acinetobacter radioresistens TaxID=40216 RepID=UPI00028CA4F1|nr:hypothetical protein [Acinetobacter radioresistens]BBL22200.1 hypothetical protein ACRAD_28710 [Acinetobacter radioresistens DSM 6976 = NBRC 102413 = CIP 103788]
MNTMNNRPKGKNLKPISKALYVLSQLANLRKQDIASTNALLRTKTESGAATDAELAELQHTVQQLSKKQQYFHAERMEVIRSLMQNKEVKVKGYVASGGYNYGVVQIGAYQFYSILNNRIIAKLKLEQLGTELEQFEVLSMEQFEVLSMEQLEEIMPVNEAEKTFKLFLAKIRLNKKKADKQAQKAKASKPAQDEVLSKSISAKGNIMVIKKRKFSDVAKANMNKSF